MKINHLFKILIGIQLICVNAHAQIHHVEPLNWWVGMKNPNLQILINGENISETTPVINYPGVTIKKINRADSKNYLFIDLFIDKIALPGSLDISFRKDGKVVYSYRYDLLKREQNAAQYQGFNSSDAIYLIVPDRFANGDYVNDVVEGMKEHTVNRSLPGVRHGGDIRGIINNLDYIKDMGFTAIWPTPMLENDMPAYSYHGYSITNHYKVDPRYGTLDDYKELAAKAKQKGLKLVFDEVLNHTGSNYWWTGDLPFKDWINFAPPHPYVGTNHRRTVNQDMYASDYDKEIWSNGWFDKTMPDMNGKNPFMSTYLTQNTIWWIETLQLAGIRQDTYGYSDKTFLKNWSCSIINEYPKLSLMGEEWSYNPLITSYWQEGKQNRDGYTSCLNTIMDFPLQDALVKSLTNKEDASYNEPFTKIYEMMANDFVYANPNQMLVMGDNHDMDRLFMQLNQDVALTQMALTFILTIRGIPQIYYGTEILMDNTGHHKVDGLIRADFTGGWKEDTANAFTGTGLNNNQLSIQSYLKKLLNWRKNNPVIATGKTVHFAPFNGIYTYFRYNKEKIIMVVMNINSMATGIDTDRFAEILKGKTTAVKVISGQTVDIKTNILINPKSAIVLEIK
ncbi:glycoside hydrolase family 13 protein [Flavihumibacter fluvii]|uniref:glycoside hydrolase family 13 protein n=1 Tax=Flavihumibacter fluvii TaxID=2838157 RepID=UPI001BDE4EFF|nr:glycoside hydrolase family 13 protein [Flavihumibacter fluvii]ULQ54743.1 glycoside hydrolase family 13 protein [Flavihumibacter fluvii]